MRRAFLAAFLTTTLLSPALGVTPPGQPEKGPGSADYPNETVIKRAVGHASAATFAFHAAGEARTARPVIIFLHSWGAANPQYYGGWIEHLARRGNLVLFPRFQEVNRTRPADATANAATLVRDALEALKDDKEARPDLERTAVIGHLAGAAIGLNLAIDPGEDGLPMPKLVFALMPGGIASDEKSRGILLEDLGKLDPNTLLITMSGDRDYLPTDRASRRILRETTAVPPNRKLFMRAPSDSHGYPVTSATLASPGSPLPAYDGAAIKLPPDPPRDPKEKPLRWKWTADMALTGEQTVLTGQLGSNRTDTLDFLAYWKTFDLALEAAFAGHDAASLRADSRFVDMGAWSDGWPMKRLTADTPKVEGEAEKPQAGPRRRIN
jgi:pimeloyl-ACP methyl ester carboxylesterase